MTTKVTILCTGNTEGDTIALRFGEGKHGTDLPGAEERKTLQRGEKYEFSVACSGRWIYIDGENGSGRSRGDPVVGVILPEDRYAQHLHRTLVEALGAKEEWHTLDEKRRNAWRAVAIERGKG